MKVFGGAGGSPHVGHWTEPVKPAWHCLMCLARMFNYSYKFEFEEDYKRADIKIAVNCCCCPCTLCLPLYCLPSWFEVPSSLVAFEMVQAEGSTDGSFWARNSSACGKPMKHTYDLVAVLKPDGSRAKYHADLAKTAPEQMIISR